MDLFRTKQSRSASSASSRPTSSTTTSCSCSERRAPGGMYVILTLLLSFGEIFETKFVQDIDIDVIALLNDTVGALMSCVLNENSCQVRIF